MGEAEEEIGGKIAKTKCDLFESVHRKYKTQKVFHFDFLLASFLQLYLSITEMFCSELSMHEGRKPYEIVRIKYKDA